MAEYTTDFSDNESATVPTGWSYVLFGSPTATITSDTSSVTIEANAKVANTGRIDTVAWTSIGTASTTDVLVKLRVPNAAVLPYAYVLARLPGTNTSTGHGYYARVRPAVGGSGTIEIGARSQYTLSSSLATAQSVGFSPDADYWLRLQVVNSEHGGVASHDVRARLWTAAGSEPTVWHASGYAQSDDSSVYVPDAGYVDLGVTVDVGSVIFYEVTVSDGVVADDPTGPANQYATDRLRSTVSDDAGSLLDSLEADEAQPINAPRVEA